ncbi:hypothetical protein CXG81DRAFT_12182 [Caulochytrium protostelioides]|nr:hypothetical protein CXG81DRAFT_12182 [Caulochytrium protostelioides]|eukprot:RKP01309.1 hypothetical protein CXG81DRAFT_12182 [Caulochytrium protostelioides]
MRSTIRYKPTVFDGAKGGSATSNSLLAVGKDRSFVVQGSKIGVFRYDDDEGLRHTATINQVNDPNAPSERFSPKKVMLHRNDREMLLLRPGDDTHVYRMDLEAGKVVDSWEVQNARVKSILPDKKYAQMTDTSTITAFSDNALFQIDPRTADKTVNLKSYAVKNGFTSAATTGKGYVAVASEKGEIRLYNKLGMNAKTLLPGFGAPITGLDVTEDGQWVLATTRTYILLIPTGIEGSAKNGFETSMKQTPPQAIKLQLDPCHAVWMRCPINYTPARFNTGEQEERYIATSTGPWVIRWNFNRVKSGHTMNYIITRTKESVVDDSFRFNRARQIVVATKANVSAMHTSLMKRPEQLRADTVKEYDN